MNYNESIEYIHGISWTFCKPGLERIEELCALLGEPQRGMRFIHVAGTNGKGSFCSMLSSVLCESGIKVGLFTSPYIRFFNERMCVNGQPISDDELADITTYVRPFADKMNDKPTEFELITAIGFEYFKRQKCDVVILEAGMGGRLDSTNVIREPLLSVITGIALDHTAFLGDTVEKIAAEKAGIIKDGRPVLYGGEDLSAAAVIRDTAKKNGSPYYDVDYSLLKVKSATLDGTVFAFGEWKNLSIKLLGSYQPRNASLVVSAVDILRREGLNISEETVRKGLENASWSARFEIISKEPLTIFDGAHNPQGIDSAVESIKRYFGEQRVYVLTGVLKDKDYMYIASRLSDIGERAFVLTPDNPRALNAYEYAEVLCQNGLDAKGFDTLAEAYSEAVRCAKRDEKTLVCLGSLYTYSEIIKITNGD